MNPRIATILVLLSLAAHASAGSEFFFPLDLSTAQNEIFLGADGVELANADPNFIYLYPEGKNPTGDKFMALTIPRDLLSAHIVPTVRGMTNPFARPGDALTVIGAQIGVSFFDPANPGAKNGWVDTYTNWTGKGTAYLGEQFPGPANRDQALTWFNQTESTLKDKSGNEYAKIIILWLPLYTPGTVWGENLDNTRYQIRNIFIKLHPRYQGVLNARYALAATTGPASPIAPPEKTGEAPTPGSIVPAGYRLGPDNQLIPLNPDGSIGTPVAPAPTANANPSTIVAATQKSENYRAWLLYPDIGESLLQALANANYAIVQKILALAEKPSGAPASPPTSVPNTVSLDAPKILKPAFAYWIAPDNSTTFAARMTTPEKRASELARFEIWALNGATMEPAEKLRIETKKEFVKSWKTLDGVEVSGYFLALDLPAGKTFAVRRKNDSGIYQDNFVTIAIQADKSIHVREDKRPDLFKP